MSALSDACTRPFANGTEAEAWESKWCAFCTRDHGATHAHEGCGDGCQILAAAYFDAPWPEAWLPEPDDGSFSLPSRMICGAFQACTEGSCTGDPGAADRAARVVEVTSYWRDRAKGADQ